MSSVPASVDLDVFRSGYKRFALDQIRSPATIGSTDLDQLEPLVREKRPLERGQALFRQGDAAHALYVVRSGSLKTFVEDPTGEAQILGFHLPGELLGVGGLGRHHYLGSAEALEHSHVWALPYAQLQLTMEQMPRLYDQLMQIIGRWTDANVQHTVMLGRTQAKQRLAMFLRAFAARYERLSIDSREWVLPMSRRELANYLGLALETVSRLFGRLEADGVLAVDRKRVHILRPDLLADLCGDGRPVARSSPTA